MISRDFRCSNPECMQEFHTFEKVPECPYCHCVRVDWIPGGGHTAKVAPRADKTQRFFADAYGMSDMNSPSPSRLNRTMPAVPQKPFDMFNGMPIHFAPGFSSPISSQPGGTCTVSSSPIDMRGRIPVGSVTQGRDGSPVNNPVPRSPSETVPTARRNAAITYLRKPAA